MGRGDSFGQKKGENREFRYTPPKPYQRLEATTPIYSAYQTKRYKSLWNRYTAGEELSRRESDQIQNDAGETVEYRFYSKRSNVGYWTVTRGASSEILYVQEIQIEYAIEEDDGSVSNSVYYVVQNINVPAHLLFFNPGDVNSGGNPLVLNYSGPVTPAKVYLSGNDSYNPDIIIAQQIPTALINSGPYLKISYQLLVEEGISILRFKVLRSRDSVDARVYPPPPANTDWACDCPDYTKEERPFVEGLWPSLQEHRVWQESEAGAPGDCKHIIAAKFLAGEPPDPPTFDTIAPDEVDLSYLKPWNPKRRQGDDFSTDLTW